MFKLTYQLNNERSPRTQVVEKYRITGHGVLLGVLPNGHVSFNINDVVQGTFEVKEVEEYEASLLC